MYHYYIIIYIHTYIYIGTSYIMPTSCTSVHSFSFPRALLYRPFRKLQKPSPDRSVYSLHYAYTCVAREAVERAVPCNILLLLSLTGGSFKHDPWHYFAEEKNPILYYIHPLDFNRLHRSSQRLFSPFDTFYDGR